MTANTDKLLSILTGILITVLVYFLAFWFHLLSPSSFWFPCLAPPSAPH